MLYEVNLAKVAKRAFVNDAFCRFYLSFVATGIVELAPIYCCCCCAAADNRFLVVESRFRTQAISHEVHDCIVENLTPEMEEAPLLLATMLSQGSSEREACDVIDY